MALALMVAALQLLPSPCGTGQARAGSRETERAREQAQQAAERTREQTQQAAERAREQAQQAAERTREQAQQAAERSKEQARQSTERSREDDHQQSGSAPQRDRERDEKPGGQRSRDERERESGKKDQDDGPPKTVLELIRRLTAPPPRSQGHNAHSGLLPQLASHELVAVGIKPAGLAKARALGFKIVPAAHGRVVRMFPPPGLDALSARDLLRAELPGDRLGVNYLYRPFRSASGDPEPATRRVQRASIGGCDTERCYGPKVIGWQPQLRSCTKDIRIGIIDTSIDRDHPAFKGRKLEVGNFLPPGAGRTVNWHGTGVLAVLAGSPDSGTPGLIPDAHFFAADVYHASEGGQPVADTASLLRAMDWMRQSRVSVINMSMSGPDDELLHSAIDEMRGEGVLFVAAAGNDGPNAPPSYPAAYRQVIAVTAVDRDLRSYIHASHGDYIDVAAPGVAIWTALPGVLEGYQSGTSFAAPHVTAVLAAMRGLVRDKGKEGVLEALAIRDLGEAGRDPIYGRGLVSAPSACTPEQAVGWVTDVVRAPAALSPPLAYGLKGSFK